MGALSRIVLLFILLLILVLSSTLFLWYKMSAPPHTFPYLLYTNNTMSKRAVPTKVKCGYEVVRVQDGGEGMEGACSDGRKDVQEKVSVRSHGFVLTSQYAGQQGAAMLALISQQCWVKRSHLPMKIVEPFLRNSFLYGFPSTYKRKRSTDVRLRDLVDLNQFNSISHEQGIDRLASWEEFVANSPREIIVVMVRHSSPQDLLPDVWAAENDSQRKHKCYSRPLITIQGMSSLARYSQTFCIVRVIHLVPDSLGQIDAIFGSHDAREVTLVFDWWSWHWDPAGSNALWNTRSGTQLTCRASIRDHLNDKLVPSQQLLRYAQDYEQRYLGWGREEDEGGVSRGANMTQVPKRCVSIAVMLRIERVVRDAWMIGRGGTDSKLLSKVNSCLAKVVEFTKDLQVKRGAERKVFVVSDFGRFGSKTWRSEKRPSKEKKREIFERVQNVTATQLVHSSLSFNQWENSFVSVTEGKDDPGYIAALQRVLASRADCLIMVGGGNFMKLAFGDYLSHHPSTPDQCVRFVCFNKRFLKEYMQFMDAS